MVSRSLFSLSAPLRLAMAALLMALLWAFTLWAVALP